MIRIMVTLTYHVAHTDGYPTIRFTLLEQVSEPVVIHALFAPDVAPFRPDQGVLVAEVLINAVPVEAVSDGTFSYTRRLWLQPEELPGYVRCFVVSNVSRSASQVGSQPVSLVLEGTGYLSDSRTVQPYSDSDLAEAAADGWATPAEVDQALKSFSVYINDPAARLETLKGMKWQRSILGSAFDSLPRAERDLIRSLLPPAALTAEADTGLIPAVVRRTTNAIRDAAVRIAAEPYPVSDLILMDDLRLALEALDDLPDLLSARLPTEQLSTKQIPSEQIPSEQNGDERTDALPLRAYLYQALADSVADLLAACRAANGDLLSQEQLRTIMRVIRFTDSADPVEAVLSYIAHRFRGGGLLESVRRDLLELIRACEVNSMEAVGFVCNQITNLDSIPARHAAVHTFAGFVFPPEHPSESLCVATAVDVLSDPDMGDLHTALIDAVGSARLWDESGDLVQVIGERLASGLSGEQASIVPLTVQTALVTTWERTRDPLLFDEQMIDQLEQIYVEYAAELDSLPMPIQMLRDIISKSGDLFKPLDALLTVFADRGATFLAWDALHGEVVDLAVRTNIGTVTPDIVEMSQAIRAMRTAIELGRRAGREPDADLQGAIERASGKLTALDSQIEETIKRAANLRAEWLSETLAVKRRAQVYRAVITVRMNALSAIESRRARLGDYELDSSTLT